MRILPSLLASIAMLASACPAAAELPEGVEAMIYAAIATGDSAKVSTVTEPARTIYGSEVSIVDETEAELKSGAAARLAVVEARKIDKIGEVRLFQWGEAEGQVGRFPLEYNSNLSVNKRPMRSLASRSSRGSR
jgi:putative salt-induced outer membrane protein